MIRTKPIQQPAPRWLRVHPHWAEMNHHTLLLVAIGVCLLGCGDYEVPVAVPPTVVRAEATELLLKTISQQGHAEFTSWNGHPRGLDSDAILRFYKDSKVELEDRGYSISYYRGSYDLRPDGRVVVTLNGFRREWPVMLLRMEDGALLLYREDGETALFPGDTYPPIQGFWPFRSN